jgi:hypothetical protein
LRTWKRILGIAVWLTAGLGSCCDEPRLKVKDMSGRLEFSSTWATNARFDVSMLFSFDGDFGAWGELSAASAATLNLKLDLSGILAYRQTLSADVDNDGVAETVKLLALSGTGPSAPDRVFMAWRGDSYTLDADRCYVMWWEGSKLELLNGQCGSAEPALHCQMTTGEPATLACDVCGATGICAPCSANEVSSCVSEGKKELEGTANASGGRGGAGASENTPGGSTNAGAAAIGGTAGFAGANALAGAAGAGATAGAAGTGGFDVGGQSAVGLGGSSSVSVSAEFSACVAQVQSLSTSASGCGLSSVGDTNTLCSNQSSAVEVCYKAVDAAAGLGGGLFNPVCSALKSACQGVFS